MPSFSDSERRLSPGGLTAAMFVATVLGMTGIVAYPALVPTFKQEWGLTNAAAGWISGVYFAGYVAAVPVLSALTDRIDAKRVVLFGLVIGVIAPVGFALTASGLASASFWWGLQGVGFAGIYMPGLKVLADRLDPAHRDRAAAVFTATFTVGVSISFSLTGVLADAFGWRVAFLLVALGPLIGVALVLWGIAPHALDPAKHPAKTFAFGAVLRNRRVLAYMIAYAVHNGESAVMRAWIVALLVFAQAGDAAPGFANAWQPTSIATVMTLLGLPGVLLASELTRFIDRRVVIAGAMTLSALTGVALGFFSSGASFGLVFALACFYGFTVTADSGTLNAGLLARADHARRGAAMAVHAVFGFTAAFLMPFVFGGVLDVTGGAQSVAAWRTAFVFMAVLIALGPLALFVLDRKRKCVSRT